MAERSGLRKFLTNNVLGRLIEKEIDEFNLQRALGARNKAAKDMLGLYDTHMQKADEAVKKREISDERELAYETKMTKLAFTHDLHEDQRNYSRLHVKFRNHFSAMDANDKTVKEIMERQEEYIGLNARGSQFSSLSSEGLKKVIMKGSQGFGARLGRWLSGRNDERVQEEGQKDYERGLNAYFTDADKENVLKLQQDKEQILTGKLSINDSLEKNANKDNYLLPFDKEHLDLAVKQMSMDHGPRGQGNLRYASEIDVAMEAARNVQKQAELEIQEKARQAELEAQEKVRQAELEAKERARLKEAVEIPPANTMREKHDREFFPQYYNEDGKFYANQLEKDISKADKLGVKGLENRETRASLAQMYMFSQGDSIEQIYGDSKESQDMRAKRGAEISDMIINEPGQLSGIFYKFSSKLADAKIPDMTTDAALCKNIQQIDFYHSSASNFEKMLNTSEYTPDNQDKQFSTYAFYSLFQDGDSQKISNALDACQALSGIGYESRMEMWQSGGYSPTTKDSMTDEQRIDAIICGKLFDANYMKSYFPPGADWNSPSNLKNLVNEMKDSSINYLKDNAAGNDNYYKDQMVDSVKGISKEDIAQIMDSFIQKPVSQPLNFENMLGNENTSKGFDQASKRKSTSVAPPTNEIKQDGPNL
ncbi:MAG: hypothetical protein FWB91_03180 [Defluviitaleaceae bacterium]|nr:hypothetical protein [Defluviitaleaceae bacterium]